MSAPLERLLDSDELASLIAGLAREIVALTPGDAPLQLVGIRRRGYPIAQRIAAVLRSLTGNEVPVGAIDITLYRDDLESGNRWPVLLGTEIPFPLDGADVVLVDDVLFTGRTVRAALNAVCDLGRPARVRLLALIDRGHRELPIQPDFVGRRIETQRDERVVVRITPIDRVDEVIRMPIDT